MSTPNPPDTTVLSTPDSLRGILLMLLAMLLFSTMDAISKQLTGSHSAVAIAWWRYAFQTLALLPALLGSRELARWQPRRPGLQAVRSFGMLGATLFFISATSLLPMAESVAIAFTSPVFITVLSVVWLGENVPIRRWLVLLLGLCGVLVVVRPGGAVFGWAALLPVGSAACWAIALNASRAIRDDDPPLTTLLHTSLFGLIALSLVIPGFWTMPPGRDALVLAALGLLSAAGQYVLIRAFTLAPASRLAPFSYSQMLWGVLAGLLMFGEVPDIWSLCGILIIVAGGLYAWRQELGQEQGQEPEAVSHVCNR